MDACNAQARRTGAYSVSETNIYLEPITQRTKVTTDRYPDAMIIGSLCNLFSQHRICIKDKPIVLLYTKNLYESLG